MSENEVFQQNRHKFVCILKEIVRGEINEEISGMFDETIEYIEEIRDAILPLRNRITELEDELLRVCDVLGDEDVALVHKLLGIKNVEDEE